MELGEGTLIISTILWHSVILVNRKNSGHVKSDHMYITKQEICPIISMAKMVYNPIVRWYVSSIVILFSSPACQQLCCTLDAFQLSCIWLKLVRDSLNLCAILDAKNFNVTTFKSHKMFLIVNNIVVYDA